jgi:predicted nucleotidyltransferase
MDISNSFNEPIIFDLLATVSEVADELGVLFFVVGATARDLILWHGFKVMPGRATQDIDIGFQVATWEDYELLKEALVKTGSFQQSGDKQRMSFRGLAWVDVLPFGEIVDPDEKIRWKPHGDTELNLLGFEEAFENSIPVKISSDPELVVNVASVVGLVLLKLFAWNDRRPGSKDAIDLGILIRSYLKLGNHERLFEEHSDLLEKEDFDYDVAGAHILGRDLAKLCKGRVQREVLAILDRELDSNSDLPLVVQSAESSPQIDRTIEFWEAIRDELRASVN